MRVSRLIASSILATVAILGTAQLPATSATATTSADAAPTPPTQKAQGTWTWEGGFIAPWLCEIERSRYEGRGHPTDGCYYSTIPGEHWYFWWYTP